MMVILVNQNLLNELVLEKIIFALAIENMMIETMTTNHHPKISLLNLFFITKKRERLFLQQSSNSSAKYRWVLLMKYFLPLDTICPNTIRVKYSSFCVTTTSTMMENDFIYLNFVRRRYLSDEFYIHYRNEKEKSRDQQLYRYRRD